MGLTLSTFRAYLSLGGDGGSDLLLQAALDGAVAECEGFTGRTLTVLPTDPAATVTVVRRTEGRVIRVPDLRDLVSVTIDGIPVDVDDVESLWPAPHPWIRVPFDRDVWCGTRRTVTVEGRFGFGTYPADLEASLYVHAARSYRERDAMYADVVDPGDGSQVTYFRQMPPKVRATWDRYRVPGSPVTSVRVRPG